MTSATESAWRKYAVCLTGTLFLCLRLAGPAAGQERPLRIGGTGSALGVMKKLAAGYQRSHPGMQVTMLPSTGSSGGIKAVLAGALDITVSSRAIEPAGQGAVAQAFARTPLVLASVNRSVSGFSLKELADIYSGRKEQWPDGRPLRLVLRPPSEFDNSLLRRMSPEMDEALSLALARKGMIMAVTDQDSADAIATVPGALGAITLAQLVSENRQFQALSLNGVVPGLAALRNGSYPYSKTFHLVTKSEPGGRVREFVEFVFSPEGREIVSRSGCEAIAD